MKKKIATSINPTFVKKKISKKNTLVILFATTIIKKDIILTNLLIF